MDSHGGGDIEAVEEWKGDEGFAGARPGKNCYDTITQHEINRYG